MYILSLNCQETNIIYFPFTPKFPKSMRLICLCFTFRNGVDGAVVLQNLLDDLDNFGSRSQKLIPIAAERPFVNV